MPSGRVILERFESRRLQGNPAGDTIEQFLTPGQTRQFRLVIRRSFGGWKGEAGTGEDRD